MNNLNIEEREPRSGPKCLTVGACCIVVGLGLIVWVWG